MQTSVYIWPMRFLSIKNQGYFIGNHTKAMCTKKKCASFFAGIGGFDLAFQNSGIKPVFQCEIDSFCNSVLARHWPKVQRHTDIRDLDPFSIPEADVWCGGFPCQDVSVARGWLGRDGLKGQNTGLFFPFAKLIENRRPQVVLMENVTGLLNSHNGQDFSIILHTLSSLGYDISWRTLNTRYFGAPQSRPRVFICAWKGSVDSAYNVLFEKGDYRELEKPRLGFLRASKCDITGAIVPEVAFCLAATSGRHTGTDWSRSYVSYKRDVRRLTPTECERIQGYPFGWTEPHEDFPLSNGDNDNHRYKAIGNAVSIPVVEWIAQRMKKELHSTSSAAIGLDVFVNNIERFTKYTPRLGEYKAQPINLSDISSHDNAPKIKWASAGVFDGSECVMGPVPQMPIKLIKSRFVDTLDKDRPNEKYFLSPSAAKGILRRTSKQGRQLFKPLTEALCKLQNKA